MECNALRAMFVKRLTVDSNHNDRRKSDYNQAIFDPKEGRACFCETDLDMVMKKFDMAVNDYLKERIKK